MAGGNKKCCALKLDVGNYSWGYECCTHKTKDVYSASNNELAHTKTLVKNCTVLIDRTPYWQWSKSHYALSLGRKKGAKLTPEEEKILNKIQSKKYNQRKIKRNMMKGKNTKINSLLGEQLQEDKLLTCSASKTGQCGRAKGYVLEGKELELYLGKIKARKGK